MGRLTPPRVRLLPKAFFLIAAWFWLAILIPTISSSSQKRSTYVVHMDKSLMPNSFYSHKQWYSTIVDSIKSTHQNPIRTAVGLGGHRSSSSRPSIIHTYDHAIHGFSASLTKDELKRLKKTPGFLLASDDKTCTLDTTHTPEYLSLSPSFGLWPASNYGQNITIGVVDSGIWPESESFKDENISQITGWNGSCDNAGQEFPPSLCNRKLIGAKYFNTGFIAANPNVTVEGINSTRDTIGHGTATASVAAGNFVESTSYFDYAKGTAKGTAPFARIAAYKVAWGPEGLAYASDVLAGIDQAIEDGVHVLLIPIGCDNVKIYEDPIVIGSFAALEKGIVVSTSAGNSGTLNNNTIHNAIPWVITVGAGSVNRWFAGRVTLGNGHTLNGWTLYPTNALIQNAPLVYNTTLSSCNSFLSLRNVTGGAIVVCDNTWPIADQISNVSAASDVVYGAIFISNDSKILEEIGGKFPFPAVVIRSNSTASQGLIAYANDSSSNPSVTIKFQQTLFNSARAPAAASYTSRGPSPYYPNALKPDIIAPGSQILAAWHPNLPAAHIGPNNLPLFSNFNILYGTSLAAAHVSGVTALLKAAHPSWSPAAIRSALITTASARDSIGSPIHDNAAADDSAAASPLAIGAGEIDTNAAYDPGLIYDIDPQDYINLLCEDLPNLTPEQVRAIIRHGYECLEFSPLNYPSFIILYDGIESNRTERRFTRTVTNVGPRGAATYTARLNVPSELNVTVSPNTLVFNETGQTLTYQVDVIFTRGDNDVTFGELVWRERSGTHTVRSPIVTAPVVQPRRSPLLATL